MLCEECGKENLEESLYCKECGAPLKEGVEPAPDEALITEKTSPVARFLTMLWERKGPILIALFLVLIMAMVFAPWAFIKLDVLGISLVSRNYNGWEIIVPRVLFFLSIIPLVVSLFLIAGISTRRRVLETHICAFFGGIIFTIWLLIFVLSELIRTVVKNVKVLEVNVAGGQIVTIFLFVGFMIGIIITSYDRGRLLAEGKDGG
jgi:hypothetical protein